MALQILNHFRDPANRFQPARPALMRVSGNMHGQTTSAGLALRPRGRRHQRRREGQTVAGHGRRAQGCRADARLISPGHEAARHSPGDLREQARPEVVARCRRLWARIREALCVARSRIAADRMTRTLATRSAWCRRPIGPAAGRIDEARLAAIAGLLRARLLRARQLRRDCRGGTEQKGLRPRPCPGARIRSPKPRPDEQNQGSSVKAARHCGSSAYATGGARQARQATHGARKLALVKIR